MNITAEQATTTIEQMGGRSLRQIADATQSLDRVLASIERDVASARTALREGKSVQGIHRGTGILAGQDVSEVSRLTAMLSVLIDQASGLGISTDDITNAYTVAE